MVLELYNLFVCYNFVVNSKAPNIEYFLCCNSQTLNIDFFKSCSSYTPNMIAFIKSQTPNIDMDPLYREVRITRPGEYLQELVPEIHHLSMKPDFSLNVEVIVQENNQISYQF